MRKILFLLLSMQIVTSCSQGVKSNSDGESEISTTSSEVLNPDKYDSDNTKEARSEFAQVDTNIVRLTKDSPDYVSSVNEMKSLEKQRQRLIEKINQKYSQYIAYNLWVRDYELQQSSHNVIKATMREERLRSY